MMELTPLEVRKKKGDFRRAMRGYDTLLVDDFLDLVADRMEQLVRENLTLQERVSRHEQLVTEYRDRERALTEALVSAQEMREEVRRQAVREAELAKSTAQQEATQLRSSAAQDAQQMRSAVEQEVERMRAAAEQESERLRAAAEQESDRLHGELERLEASIAIEREREEETVRHLRARQQQFLASYRAFLERELTELGALAKTLAAVTGADFDEAALAELTSAVASGAAPFDAGVAPRGRPRAVEEIAAVAAEPFEPEPFEPESFEPEDAEVRPVESEQWDIAAASTLEAAHGAPVEPGLYDGVAADADGDGIPGPIGLGDVEQPAAAGWQEPDLDTRASALDLDDTDQPELLDLELVEETVEPGAFDLEEEDAETNELLRNAAAAGYRLTEEVAPEEELLLDEAVVEEERPDEDDDGWLPTLLDDDR